MSDPGVNANRGPGRRPLVATTVKEVSASLQPRSRFIGSAYGEASDAEAQEGRSCSVFWGGDKNSH